MTVMRLGNERNEPVNLLTRGSMRLVVGILFVICASDPLAAQDLTPDVPLEEAAEESPRGEIQLTVVDAIGEPNPKEHDHYLFGGVTKSGLHVSPSGELWVLDRQLDNLRRYTSEGIYIDGHRFPRGRGPGEMVDPTALVVDDSLGLIYIGDTDGFRVTVFDTSMSPQATFPIEHTYFDLYPWSEGEGVLVVPWRRNIRPDSSVVRIYGRSGDRISDFARINYHTRENIEAELKSGAYTTFRTETSTYYFIAVSYPYEIFAFDKESHNLTHRFTRPMAIYDEIIDVGDERVGEHKVPGGRSAGLMAVNEHLILHFINDQIHEETIIHAFDEQGRVRGSFPWSDVSNTPLPPNIATADGPGNTFYVVAREPYTHILKLEARSREQ